MTSTNIESIAADTNVLLSAVAGRAAGRVFDKTELIVVTTEKNVAEVIKYLPVFGTRYGISEELLVETLDALPLEIYREDAYAAQIPAAADFLAGRDDDDIALAALALTLQIPIWSNDRDYERFQHGTFTTAQLLKFLQI